MAWKKTSSKFYNQKTKVKGRVFDSRKEARRYQELLILQQAGEIRGLECQVPFPLIPAQKYKDPVTGRWKTERGTKYVADFVYTTRDGERVVEDVKGVRTKEYIIKRKLMLWLDGIHIVEV